MKNALVFGLAMTISGTIGFLAKGAGLNSLTLVFARCALASVFLALYVYFTKRTTNLSVIKSEAGFILLAGFALVSNWVFLFRAFQVIPITIAISLYYLAPIFVYLFGLLFLKEKARLSDVAAVLLAFVGTLLVSSVFQPPQGAEAVSLSGCLDAVIAAVLYATLMICGRRIQKTDPAVVSLVQTALGAICLLPFAVFPELTVGEISRVVTLGVVHTGILYILFFASIRHLSANWIAVLSFLDPGVAILGDRFLFHQQLSVAQWVGTLFIFGAVIRKAYSPARP